MASRMRRALEGDERAPEVIVDFEYQDGLLFISVENVGSASAYKVSVKFDKKVTGVDGTREISSLNLFRRLEFLPPKKKIRAFLDSLYSYLARGQPKVLNTVVTFQGKDGRRMVERTRHDLSIYEDLPESWQPPRASSV